MCDMEVKDGILEIDLSKLGIDGIRLIGKDGKSIASETGHLIEALEWLVRFVDVDTRITVNGVEERLCE